MSRPSGAARHRTVFRLPPPLSVDSPAVVARSTRPAAPSQPGRRRGRARLIGTAVAVALLAAMGTAALGWAHGWRLYVVRTASMVPALAPGDAVLDRPASSGVRPGDVVTFAVRSGPDLVVTHRAMSVTGDLITTKGDANETADPWTVRTQHVVGVPQLTLPRVGYVLVFLQQPQGALALLTSGLALIMLWQLFFAADDRHLVGLRAPRHRNIWGWGAPRRATGRGTR